MQCPALSARPIAPALSWATGTPRALGGSGPQAPPHEQLAQMRCQLHHDGTGVQELSAALSQIRLIAFHVLPSGQNP